MTSAVRIAFIAATLVLPLGACVSEADRQQQIAEQEAARVADAACKQKAATHLAVAKCETVAAVRDVHPSPANADLLFLFTSQRENIADKLDKGLITQQEANLEMATAYSQLSSTVQQRNLMAAQQLAALQAAEPPPRPIIYSSPRSVHCTTTRNGMFTNTDCN